MPLPLMVRLDDDVAEKLREQAYVDHVPMNRIINDVLRQYYEGKTKGPVATEDGDHIAKTFRERLQPAIDAVQSLPFQENAADYRAKTQEALTKMMDCVTAVMLSIDPTLTPKVSYSPKTTRKQSKEKVEA